MTRKRTDAPPPTESPRKPPRGRPRRPHAPANTTNGAPAPPPPPSAAPTGEWACATAATGSAERSSYLWDRRIVEGAVCLLSGDQSAGKSTLCCSLAAALTTVSDFPGLVGNESSYVLWMGAEEDPRRDIAPRLFAAGADLKRVVYPEWSDSWTARRLFLPRHAETLRSVIRRYRARLLVIDPISSHVESGLASETGGHVRSVLEALANVCRAERCAALCVRHPRKGAVGPLIERVSGSREWIAVPRTVLYLTTPDPDSSRRVLVTLKPGPPLRPEALAGRLVIREGSSALEWDGVTSFGEDEAGAAADSPADRSAMAEAMQFLRDHLSEDRQKSTEMQRWAQEAGLSWGTIQRAKVRLKIHPTHIREGDSWAWYWLKPEGGWAE